MMPAARQEQSSVTWIISVQNPKKNHRTDHDRGRQVDIRQTDLVKVGNILIKDI
jgi:hypothetical protein